MAHLSPDVGATIQEQPSEYPAGWLKRYYALRKRDPRLARRYVEELDAAHPTSEDWLPWLLETLEQLCAAIEKPDHGFERVLFHRVMRPARDIACATRAHGVYARPRERRARSTRRTGATASAADSGPPGPPPAGLTPAPFRNIERFSAAALEGVAS
jgi:hypothetical protein